MGQTGAPNELYNLRWNSYFTNLTNVFTEHQHQESLVDITIGCEGQFIKAHKLVLSACSVYFQKIFQSHASSPLLILLNDVKFESLKMVIQFMYKGEVKVAEADMQSFLNLGKMLQVKGLCSVELQDKQKSPKENKKEAETSKAKESPKKDSEPKTKPAEKKIKTPERRKAVPKGKQSEVKNAEQEEPQVKKRKLPSPAKSTEASAATTPPPGDNKITHIPRPPNAFMIFANQWRKKLAVEYPSESNKDISVRLGNMWKSLAVETKESFYEDALRAEEEHQIKYPGYYYSPREARNRKAQAIVVKSGQKTNQIDDLNESDVIEIKSECTGIDDSSKK